MTIVNDKPDERHTVTKVLQHAIKCNRNELKEAIRLLGIEINKADRNREVSVPQLQDTLKCLDHIGKLRFRSWSQMRTMG